MIKILYSKTSSILNITLDKSSYHNKLKINMHKLKLTNLKSKFILYIHLLSNKFRKKSQVKKNIYEYYLYFNS